jgi:hypothetical protein
MRATLQIWATAAGTILCAESCLTDALGIAAGDVVGRSFSNLCLDVEGVNKCAPPLAACLHASTLCPRAGHLLQLNNVAGTCGSCVSATCFVMAATSNCN